MQQISLFWLRVLADKLQVIKNDLQICKTFVSDILHSTLCHHSNESRALIVNNYVKITL